VPVAMSYPRSASQPARRPIRRLLAVAVLLALALAALVASGALGSLSAGALTMLPAIALVAIMLARPYAGERALARLRAARARRVRRAGTRSTPVLAWRVQRSLARGGRLIAVALAGRAPPPAHPACR
jgi:hypothetical protein